MVRSDIYKAVRDRLLEAIEGLTVDVNRGQMNDPKADYPIPVPVALVGISDIRWAVLDGRLQHGKITVAVDYFKVICSGTFSGAEAEDETLALLDSPGEIYEALQSYEVDGLFYGLSCLREQELRAGGRLAGYRLTFEADVYESNV
jgi:hypothetical protein